MENIMDMTTESRVFTWLVPLIYNNNTWSLIYCIKVWSHTEGSSVSWSWEPTACRVAAVRTYIYPMYILLTIGSVEVNLCRALEIWCCRLQIGCVINNVHDAVFLWTNLDVPGDYKTSRANITNMYIPLSQTGWEASVSRGALRPPGLISHRTGDFPVLISGLNLDVVNENIKNSPVINHLITL